MQFKLLNWKAVEAERLASIKVLFNNEELIKNVNSEIELLKNTLDELSELPQAELLMKEKRAHYKHFIEAMDVYRRDLKNKWNRPFQCFEEELKNIIKIIDDGVALLDQKLNERKLEKYGMTSKISKRILDERTYTIVADNETHAKIRRYIAKAVNAANDAGKFSAEILDDRTNGNGTNRKKGGANAN